MNQLLKRLHAHLAARPPPAPEPPQPARLVSITTGATFELGDTVMTPGVLELNQSGALNVAYVLARHQRRDWGDVCQADARRNDLALRDGERILSAYNLPCGTVWVITDATGADGHRAVTTILLPHEY
jgi:hypothetical protein